jgi:hypothetical protein
MCYSLCVSRMHPSKYMSVQIDGMDQKKTNLPHFQQKLKSTDSITCPLNTHVVGAIAFGAPYPLTVWIDSGGMYPNDSNLLVTQLMHLIRDNFHVRDNARLFKLHSETTRPSVLYLQMDNASANKSMVLLAFCAMLVWRKVFRKVYTCTQSCVEIQYN